MSTVYLESLRDQTLVLRDRLDPCRLVEEQMQQLSVLKRIQFGRVNRAESTLEFGDPCSQNLKQVSNSIHRDTVIIIPAANFNRSSFAMAIDSAGRS